MTTIDLTSAADLLAARGWTQGTMVDEQGRLCLTGALRACDLHPGDWPLARAVLRREGRGEDWNDTVGRTQEEVEDVLRGRDITDDDLAATFGPQWAGVVAVVRRAAVLTPDEAIELDAALDAARDAAWAAAWHAPWAAARSAARGASRGSAGDAAGEAAGDATWDGACAAARATARATAVADLAGQHGLTQEHIDILRGPWLYVIGPTWQEQP